MLIFTGQFQAHMTALREVCRGKTWSAVICRSLVSVD